MYDNSIQDDEPPCCCHVPCLRRAQCRDVVRQQLDPLHPPHPVSTMNIHPLAPVPGHRCAARRRHDPDRRVRPAGRSAIGARDQRQPHREAGLDVDNQRDLFELEIARRWCEDHGISPRWAVRPNRPTPRAVSGRRGPPIAARPFARSSPGSWCTPAHADCPCARCCSRCRAGPDGSSLQRDGDRPRAP